MLTTEHQQVLMWDKLGKLYQGCHPCIYGWTPIWGHFDALINLNYESYAEDGYKKPIPEGVLCLHWPINDGPLPDKAKLFAVGRFVAHLVDDGMRVLVHCWAGQNRSALVTAVAIHLLSQQELLGTALYNHVKSRQPMAFTNQTFRDYIQTLGVR